MLCILRLSNALIHKIAVLPLHIAMRIDWSSCTSKTVRNLGPRQLKQCRGAVTSESGSFATETLNLAEPDILLFGPDDSFLVTQGFLVAYRPPGVLRNPASLVKWP